MNRIVALSLMAIMVLSTTLAGCVSNEESEANWDGAIAPDSYEIVIFHNNDGESDIIREEDRPGIAGFVHALSEDRDATEDAGHGTLTLSSGDNFLAGSKWDASTRSNPQIYYDAKALDAIDYDAICIGNHDFDFGPSVLAEFIEEEGSTPFLSANIDVSNDAALAGLETSGRLASSTRVVVPVDNGEGHVKVGIIGAVTENLPFISSPGKVDVTNVSEAVNAEAATLNDAGADLIILISHLQGYSEDKALVPLLSNVDVVVAGGGDELLANSNTSAHEGHSVVDTYPVLVNDAGNNPIPIITTMGQYMYYGRAVVSVSNGDVSLTGDPVKVSFDGEQDAGVLADIEAPVKAHTDSLAEIKIGNAFDFAFQGAKDDIRARETNVGNLVTDSMLWYSAEVASTYGTPTAQVAMTNGGGLRASVNPDGNASYRFSVQDTFDVAPFGNRLVLVEDMTSLQMHNLLENVYSKTVATNETTDGVKRDGDGTGRFAQLAGMSVVYDVTKQALVLDADGNVVTAGERIISATLDDGTKVVENGEPVAGVTVDLVTVDYIANGGDQWFHDWPDKAATYTDIGALYQQALSRFIEANPDLSSYSTTSGRITALTA
ncbi:MAG: bifunctional metallophosphatase/5'-nucleotidase [Euryarchaeota archaeon TMED141]|nr:MAG: bifunctional metallophosphatase/5'-nucleotidase [Euryarchaeota archaeon TMED141]